MSNLVFVFVGKDRHIDVQVELFSTQVATVTENGAQGDFKMSLKDLTIPIIRNI